MLDYYHLIHPAGGSSWFTLHPALPGLEAELLLGANCLPAVLLLLCKSNLGNIGGPRPVSQCSEGGYENQSHFTVHERYAITRGSATKWIKATHRLNYMTTFPNQEWKKSARWKFIQRQKILSWWRIPPRFKIVHCQGRVDWILVKLLKGL